MVKKHRITNLKYLCKTIQENHNKYSGSGKYWKNHLKVHGNNVMTRVIFSSYDFEEFKKVCLLVSNKWNVVESEDWANLKHENGTGGCDYQTEETKEKIGNFFRNKKRPKSFGEAVSKAKKDIPNLKLKGRTRPKSVGDNISKAKKGTKFGGVDRHTEKTKKQMSESALGKLVYNDGINEFRLHPNSDTTGLIKGPLERQYWNDGEKNYLLTKHADKTGLVKGLLVTDKRHVELSNATKNKLWFNDGKKNFRKSPQDDITGLIKGRLSWKN